MLKNIKQYINDLCFQLSHSCKDDIIWIYIPLLVLTIGAFTLFAAWSALVIKVLS